MLVHQFDKIKSSFTLLWVCLGFIILIMPPNSSRTLSQQIATDLRGMFIKITFSIFFFLHLERFRVEVLTQTYYLIFSVPHRFVFPSHEQPKDNHNNKYPIHKAQGCNYTHQDQSELYHLVAILSIVYLSLCRILSVLIVLFQFRMLILFL